MIIIRAIRVPILIVPLIGLIVAIKNGKHEKNSSSTTKKMKKNTNSSCNTKKKSSRSSDTNLKKKAAALHSSTTKKKKKSGTSIEALFGGLAEMANLRDLSEEARGEPLRVGPEAKAASRCFEGVGA